MHCFRPFLALLLAAPLLGTVSSCTRKTGAPVAAQAVAQSAATNAPAPFQAPAPGEAERIGAGGDEFNPRISAWAEQGHYKDIITAARIRLQKEPEHLGARYALAHSLYFNGEFDEAALEAQKVVQSPQYQNDASANELLSDARTLAKRYAGQKIAPIVWTPGDVADLSDQWKQRGAALMAAGHYDEIEATFAKLSAQPEVMADGSWTLTPFYQGLARNDGTEAGWKASHARIEAWVAARPKSQLAALSLARSWNSGAWIARGDAYADKVSEAAWALAEERQAKAAPLFRKLLNAPTAFSPLVYASALRYGQMGSAPRDWQDKVFERGIAQFPQYSEFYLQRAGLLLPRWYGDPGEWESDAARVADAQTDATEGDKLYARIVWGQWDFYSNMNQETNVDWPRTKRGFDALLKQYPGSLTAPTIYLRLCQQWSDYDTAREVLQIIGGRADASQWRHAAAFAQKRNFLLNAS